jgi:hypothetical protein
MLSALSFTGRIGSFGGEGEKSFDAVIDKIQGK